MGAHLCGGGTHPSDDPASPSAPPNNENNWRNCRACQLRDQLCDMCAAAHGPAVNSPDAAADKPQVEAKKEVGNIRSKKLGNMSTFDSQHIEQNPDVAEHPDWYDPNFQPGNNKKPVVAHKLKALRDEFDEDEEDGGPPQHSQQAPFRDVQDEFTYSSPTQRAGCLAVQVTSQAQRHSPAPISTGPEFDQSSPSAASPAAAGSLLVSMMDQSDARMAMQTALARPDSVEAAQAALAELAVCSDLCHKVARLDNASQLVVDSVLMGLMDSALLPMLREAWALGEGMSRSLPKLASALDGKLNRLQRELVGGSQLVLACVGNRRWCETACELAMLASAIEASNGVGLDTCSEAEKKCEAWQEMSERLFGCSLSQMPWLLSPQCKAWLLYVHAIKNERHKLNIRVRRDHLLEDAMHQILECATMPCLVFPRFVGAGGHDEFGEGHGLRKEMFGRMLPCMSAHWKPVAGLPQLLVDCDRGETQIENLGSAGHKLQVGYRVLFEVEGFDALVTQVDKFTGSITLDRPCPVELSMAEPKFEQPNEPLLLCSRATGHLYPNPAVTQTPDAEQSYEAIGWAIAQAPINRVVFGVPLAPAVFAFLLPALQGLPRWQPSMDELSGFDPAGHQGLVQMCNQLDQAQFAEFVQSEGFAAGTTCEQYCAAACAELMLHSVEWQLTAIVAGFVGVEGARDSWAMLGLYPAEAAVMVCGIADENDSDFDLRDYFRVSVDEALESSGLADALWRVIAQWEPTKKRDLLDFVTGSRVLPPPLSEPLRIEQAYVPDGTTDSQVLHRAPCAHTCQNVLEVPPYKTNKLEEVLERQLLMALEYGAQSYGMDDITNSAGRSHTPEQQVSPGPESPFLDIPDMDNNSANFTIEQDLTTIHDLSGTQSIAMEDSIEEIPVESFDYTVEKEDRPAGQDFAPAMGGLDLPPSGKWPSGLEDDVSDSDDDGVLSVVSDESWEGSTVILN